MNTNISNYQEEILLQFSKNEDITTKNYFKFRAEVESDVIDFHRNLMEVSDSYFVIWQFGYSRVFCLPDVECKLTTNLSIDQVRNYMKLNVDSHVMIETLNYADQYDGKRYQID
jgi:hypothetical protein